MEIINSQQLKNYTLKFNDVVIFKVKGEELIYRVKDFYLSIDKGFNDYIFNLLKLDKDKICSKSYGYTVKSCGSIWPECNDDDYEALTRVSKVLFKIIENKLYLNIKVKSPKLIFKL